MRESEEAQIILSKEEYADFIKFKLYFQAVEGKTSFKSQLQVIADPDQLLTSSHFSVGQAHAMASGISAAKQWPWLKPLELYLLNLARALISLQRKGRKEQIEFTSAMMAREILKRGGFLQDKGEEKK